MSKIRNLVIDSQDVHFKYSHDCWGSTTSDEYYSLNTDKLAENVVKECLTIINNRLVGCTIEQREILHKLKDDFRKEFGE